MCFLVSNEQITRRDVFATFPQCYCSWGFSSFRCSWIGFSISNGVGTKQHLLISCFIIFIFVKLKAPFFFFDEEHWGRSLWSTPQNHCHLKRLSEDHMWTLVPVILDWTPSDHDGAERCNHQKLTLWAVGSLNSGSYIEIEGSFECPGDQWSSHNEWRTLCLVYK